jgi:RNA polymerase sigma-70 factor (ECF subfamily)
MDEGLVVLAQQGDRGAFESLTLAHYERLFRVAQSILRDRHAAEDATQQALIDIWRYIRRLRDPGRFNGWSYRVLVHACYAEAKRTVPNVGRVEWLADDVVSSVDGYSPIVDRDELERAFRRMSLDQRAVVVLRHLAGMTPDEVAEVLGIPRRTVYSRLRRAETTLRAALEADARPALPTLARVRVIR